MKRSGKFLPPALVLLAPSAAPAPPAWAGPAFSDEAAKVSRLRAIVPPRPPPADANTLQIMREAAETKRAEVIPLLIRCLAFNSDPDSSNELLTQDMLFPSIGLLKAHYGDDAAALPYRWDVLAPLLYREAVGSDQRWYRDRIVVAVRALLSPGAVQGMHAKSLADTRANPNAADFARSLATGDLRLALARPDEEIMKRLDERARQLQEQQRKKN